MLKSESEIHFNFYFYFLNEVKGKEVLNIFYKVCGGEKIVGIGRKEILHTQMRLLIVSPFTIYKKMISPFFAYQKRKIIFHTPIPPIHPTNFHFFSLNKNHKLLILMGLNNISNDFKFF
jgi:hypothetical protein